MDSSSERPVESSGPQLATVLKLRDEREKRDWRDGESSKFQELRVALFSPVPLVSPGFMI